MIRFSHNLPEAASRRALTRRQAVRKRRCVGYTATTLRVRYAPPELVAQRADRMAIHQRPTTAAPEEHPQGRAPEPATAFVPPLENGDRLTRAEFERRYEAMPHLKKAELIDGVVYVGSPVRHNQHGEPDSVIGS